MINEWADLGFRIFLGPLVQEEPLVLSKVHPLHEINAKEVRKTLGLAGLLQRETILKQCEQAIVEMSRVGNSEPRTHQ